MRTEDKRLSPRQKAEDILIDVSWQSIAHRYFGKSSSWFYHKFNERDVNGTGVPYKFTDKELEILKGGLCDLAKRIRKVADTL